MMLIFLTAGFIALAIAAFLTVKHVDKLNRYVRTKAVIVGFDDDGGVDEETIRTVVEYPVEGTLRQTRIDTHLASFSVGDELSAAYDPEDPSEVILTGFKGWLGIVICGFIGLVAALVAGIGLYLFQFRPRLQERKGINSNDKPTLWEQ